MSQDAAYCSLKISGGFKSSKRGKKVQAGVALLPGQRTLLLSIRTAGLQQAGGQR